MGVNIWPGYECLFIARSLRLFGSQPIKLVEYPSTPEVIRAFTNRAIEFAALTGDEFLRLSADEPELRAILVMGFSKGADAVIGRPELTSLRDLRRRKVGVEINALGVYMLTRALAHAGLAREEVEIVPLENDGHVSAFKQGRVDAVVTFEPHRAKLLKDGGKVLFDSAAIPGEIVEYLVTRESTLEARPEVARTILEGWFKARERLFNDAEEVARLVSSRESVTPAEFIRSLELLEIPSRERNRQMLQGDGKALASLRNTHELMVQSGLYQGGMPKADLLNGRFL